MSFFFLAVMHYINSARFSVIVYLGAVVVIPYPPSRRGAEHCDLILGIGGATVADEKVKSIHISQPGFERAVLLCRPADVCGKAGCTNGIHVGGWRALRRTEKINFKVFFCTCIQFKPDHMQTAHKQTQTNKTLQEGHIPLCIPAEAYATERSPTYSSFRCAIKF